MYQAYLAYLLSRYPVKKGVGREDLKSFLLKLCSCQSIYARDNALRALAMLGDVEDCIAALDIISRGGKMAQIKLLTECLTAFSGNREKYLQGLIDNFRKYTNAVKIAILNYARLASDRYKDKIFILLKTESNEEVLFACLRYFVKYPCDEAFDYIIALGREKLIQEEWGFVAVITLTMRNYPRGETLDFLGKAVTCKDWSCRENAARIFIEQYGEEAATIVKGFQDKYADEMVQYQIQSLLLKKDVRV